MTDALTIVVHGESGVGKSYLGDTAPAPRLILDVEGGIRFTKSKKAVWDTKDPPRNVFKTPDVETAVVKVRRLDVLQEAFAWLNQGDHPFRSVVIDSLTEAQKRAVDQIAGTAQMKTQDWGSLLRKMENLVRAFRDLTMHPVKPLDCVVFVCGSKADAEGIVRPNLQGQMGTTLPYYVDVVAHLSVVFDETEDFHNVASFRPVGGIVAKDRTGRLGATMADPSIPRIFEAVYGPVARKEVASGRR